MHPRSWLASFLALCLLVLAGCASSPPPISQAQTLTGQEGAVVFRLITNGKAADDPTETLSSITLKRELAAGEQPKSDDTAILRRTTEMTSTTAIFSGMVAPGRYRVSHGNGFFANITYTFPLQGRLSAFEVKSGQVSLLGTVLVQPLEGRRFAVGYLAPEAELMRSFESLFPALAQQTRGQAENRFEPSPEMERATRFTPAFRTLTTASGALQAHADGSLLIGGKMGQMNWRKPGQTGWQRVQIDTWLEVLSLRPWRQGLLAAGEEGLLRYSADEGRSWQVLTPPAPGLIAAAEPLSNGKVLALVRRGTTWSAHISDDPLTQPWRAVARFEQERSLNVPWQNAQTLSSGDRVGVLMPNGEYLVVDGITEKLERRSLGVSIFSAQAQANGMLVVRGGNFTAGTRISQDGGRSWTELDTSRFLTAIAFASPTTAYAVTPIAPGVFAGDYALMVSRDGTKTWSKAGEVPGGVPHLVRALHVDASDGALLAFLNGGRVLRSTDEGKTWSRNL